MQMNSQEDMFATQEPKKKKIRYEFVILCDKDGDAPQPFSLYPTMMFTEDEIQIKWLESILDESSRLKSLNTIESISGKNLSLFGKIEEGIFCFFEK